MSSKIFGSDPITARGTELERIPPWGAFDYKIVTPTIDEDDKQTREFLKEVWDKYGGYTGIQLSNLTHVEDSPWHKVWHDKGGSNEKGVVIDDSAIKKYYYIY